MQYLNSFRTTYFFNVYNETGENGKNKPNNKALNANCIFGRREIRLWYLILVCISLTTCAITNDALTTRIEIMKPGIFNIPQTIKTVALINNVSDRIDKQPFTYFNYLVYEKDIFNDRESKASETDSTIKYRSLSNSCLDALSWELKKEGYFTGVINYHDSLPNINWSDKERFNPDRLFQQTESDLCIFLDQFSFNIQKYKDFEYATNIASLTWTLVYKKDTSFYTYEQKDGLNFTASDFSPELTGNMKIKFVVNNSARSLGQSFCSKIIPTWIPVDRIYYTSKNPEMVQAEKLALSNDWLKAAEIWNRQTKSKDIRIAAKASYNLAVASEMEGNMDIAIDWLVRSSSILKKKNSEDHKLNCQNYISILTERKKEIEKLSKQVRN